MVVDRPRVTGVLLAAGAGRRAGGPKALRYDADPSTDSECGGPSTGSGGGVSWLARSVDVLLTGGCADVVVVLGSAADQARTLLPADVRVRVVEAPDWAEGMSRALRAGLTALVPTTDAALVHLVDLPDVTAPVVHRVLVAAPTTASSLARAAFDGHPGHPVLIGADHFDSLFQDLDSGPADAGARRYLSQQRVTMVECGDLATGQDQDGLG